MSKKKNSEYANGFEQYTEENTSTTKLTPAKHPNKFKK